MPQRLSFREALARRDETPTERRIPSGFPVRVILSAGPMPQPVSVARVLRSLGHSLKKAHEILDRLAEGQSIPTELMVPEGRDAATELHDLGVHMRTLERPHVDLRALRQRLGLTQPEFAIRFGLELDTVQNWEQGRYSPDPAALVLLKVIERTPEAVDAALAAE